MSKHEEIRELYSDTNRLIDFALAEAEVTGNLLYAIEDLQEARDQLLKAEASNDPAWVLDAIDEINDLMAVLRAALIES